MVRLVHPIVEAISICNLMLDASVARNINAGSCECQSSCAAIAEPVKTQDEEANKSKKTKKRFASSWDAKHAGAEEGTKADYLSNLGQAQEYNINVTHGAVLASFPESKTRIARQCLALVTSVIGLSDSIQVLMHACFDCMRSERLLMRMCCRPEQQDDRQPVHWQCPGPRVRHRRRAPARLRVPLSEQHCWGLLCLTKISGSCGGASSTPVLFLASAVCQELWTHLEVHVMPESACLWIVHVMRELVTRAKVTCVQMHIVKNWLVDNGMLDNTIRVPLILGIWGGKGQGMPKSTAPTQQSACSSPVVLLPGTVWCHDTSLASVGKSFQTELTFKKLG